VDQRLLPLDLAAWLDARDSETFGTTRSAAAGPFSPLITAAGWELSWWWFWEHGAPAKDKTVFNAKRENLTRGLWREPFDTRRVLIPASYYFERANQPGVTGRYRFFLPGEPVFAIAGISAVIDGAPVPSCFAMVTRAPTDAAAKVHNRMPLSIPPSFYNTWLDPERRGGADLSLEALAASEEIVRQFVYERA